MARADIADTDNAVWFEGGHRLPDGLGATSGDVHAISAEAPGQGHVVFHQHRGAGRLADLHQALDEGRIGRFVLGAAPDQDC